MKSIMYSGMIKPMPIIIMLGKVSSELIGGKLGNAPQA